MTHRYTVIGSKDGSADSYFSDSAEGADGKYKPDGSIKRNPYNRSIEKVTFQPDVYGVKMPIDFSEDWVYPFPYDTNLYSDALNKAIEKANGHSIALGNDLGTIGQTTRMFEDTAKRLGTSLRFLRKGNLPRALNALGLPKDQRKLSDFKHSLKPGVVNNSKVVAGLWLELQYGWKPLLSDVYQGAMRLKQPREWVFKVSSKHNQDTLPLIWNSYPGVHDVLCNGSLRESVTIYGINTEVMDDYVGFGLDDPASLLWEVLPWSFIVDWMFSVGDYLNQRHQVPNIHGKFVVVTKSERTSIVRRYYKDSPPNELVTLFTMNTSYWSSYDRTGELTTLDIPLPTLHMDKQVFSPAHMKNALALLVQQIRL